MPINDNKTPRERIVNERESINAHTKKNSPTSVGLIAIPTKVKRYILPYFHTTLILSWIFSAISFKYVLKKKPYTMIVSSELNISKWKVFSTNLMAIHTARENTARKILLFILFNILLVINDNNNPAIILMIIVTGIDIIFLVIETASPLAVDRYFA